MISSSFDELGTNESGSASTSNVPTSAHVQPVERPIVVPDVGVHAEHDGQKLSF